MARKKLSEFRAKKLLTTEFNLPFESVSFSKDDTPEKLTNLDQQKTYVVKVDEGIKKRMKQGLVILDVPAAKVAQAAKDLFAKNYNHVIIEPFLKHPQQTEKYLSLSCTRKGIEMLYSEKGGIDIEEHQDSIQKIILPASLTGLPDKLIQKLLHAFNTYYFSFLEINPLILQDEKITFLDIAAEVDDTAAFFVQEAWDENDFRGGQARKKMPEEKAIAQLASKSQAAFSLEVLNPNGSIFMMLSGGGASIVLADEVYNQGYGKELANYGEYSGNPKAEETYLYAKNILSLLLKSQAKQKVLIIAGGVANFTDVRITFNGLIKAITEVSSELKKQDIKIFVRRGGPYQEEGLANMHQFLKTQGLLGLVSGPELLLTEVVMQAIKEIKK